MLCCASNACCYTLLPTATGTITAVLGYDGVLLVELMVVIPTAVIKYVGVHAVISLTLPLNGNRTGVYSSATNLSYHPHCNIVDARAQRLLSQVSVRKFPSCTGCNSNVFSATQQAL